MTESTMAEQRPSLEALAELDREFENAPAGKVLAWAVDTFGGSLVLAASFEDVVLIDLATKAAPGIEVIFLDTGAHFPETLAFVEEIRARYRLNLTVTKPGPEAVAYPCGSDQCCQFRKVAPLRQAVQGSRAWLTALKRVDAPSGPTRPSSAGTRRSAWSRSIPWRRGPTRTSRRISLITIFPRTHCGARATSPSAAPRPRARWHQVRIPGPAAGPVWTRPSAGCTLSPCATRPGQPIWDGISWPGPRAALHPALSQHR